MRPRHSNSDVKHLSDTKTCMSICVTEGQIFIAGRGGSLFVKFEKRESEKLLFAQASSD